MNLWEGISFDDAVKVAVGILILTDARPFPKLERLTGAAGHLAIDVFGSARTRLGHRGIIVDMPKRNM